MAETSRLVLGRYDLKRSQGRTPWYRCYEAEDLQRSATVVLKIVRLAPGGPRTELEAFSQWYRQHLSNTTGAVKVLTLHCEQEQLFVIEQPPEGEPWSLVIQPGMDLRKLRPRLHDLFGRFAEFHRHHQVHGCLLPDNLWWHPKLGWQIADGWLAWAANNGYVPESGLLPDCWTPMQDAHQLGALLAYTLLEIDITTADLPLRATSELKRRARQLEAPWPVTLLQLWGPAVTEEWSPLGLAQQALDGKLAPPPEIITPLTGPAAAVPIAGSIATAAALSAGAAGDARQTSPSRPGVRQQDPSTKSASAIAAALPADPQDRTASRRESSKLAAVVFYSLLAALIFTAGTLIALSNFLFRATVTPVEVPDVVGMSVTAAKREVEPKGFTLTVTGAEYSADYPRDRVIRQSPGAHTTVKEFREIFVTLSRGGRTIKLPSLVGLTEAAAVESLVKLELKPGRVTYQYTREVKAGQVIDQDPPANQMLAKEEPVHLVVSRGALKGEITMPNLTGRPLAAALNQLQSSKLRVRRIVRRYDYDATSPTVALQSPNAGALVDEGSDVYLTVVAPKSQEPIGEFQIRVTTNLPAIEGQQEVRMVVRDGRGERVVYQKMHSGTDKIELLVDAYMGTRILIYLDGKLIREEQY